MIVADDFLAGLDNEEFGGVPRAGDEFTEQGHVVLHIEPVSPVDQDTVSLEFSVIDTGIGIDPATAAAVRVLHPGRQFHDTQIRRHRARSGDMQAAGGDDGGTDRSRE